MKTENGTKTTYTYNALNQLVKENDTVYKYDDAGNLISTTSSDKSAAYTYNAENKLIRATVNEAGKTVVEEYTYDYAGNRTSKTTGSETVKYLNDNSILTNVLAEVDTNGNELCYYTIGADLISQERSSKTSLYFYDGHGSVRGLIDENGKVTDTYNYDAFGNLLDKTGTTVNNYLYCGEQFDSATGLYYLRARYMNPATGTFITQDTYSGTVFEPATLHKYLYANANPVMYIDPSGYMSVENDLDFYQQAWLTIDQATDYETKLICNMHNEVSYDFQVMQIGKEIIHQLRNTGLEYALTYVLEPYVGPDVARLIANGIVTALDIAISSRNKACNNKNGIISGDNYINVDDNNVTVGRWMCNDEYEAMMATGKIQPSPNNPHVKHVAYPSDMEAFGKQAAPGSVYVEFDVPLDSVKPAGSGWARIPGPDSPESRLNEKRGGEKLQFPDIINIRKVGEKK